MIKIYKATFGDLKVLQEISRSTFYEAFSGSNSQEDMQQYLTVNFGLDKLSCELSEPDSQFFMAWDKERVVGYLKVNFGQAQSDLKENHSLEIERIYVLNAYYGKKVGQLLYEQALKVAVDSGKSSVWLGVWERNARAIRFYEKNGFTTFGTHVFRLGEDEQIDLMMRKSILLEDHTYES